jgi:lipopolysaccharide/colanic/teichoic acid biosynthesis glycosyltransferase
MPKRILDVTVALIMLILSAPLLLIGFIGIWASSPGPLIYRARRIGRNGVPFDMLKLRTMTVATDGRSAITAPCDPRVFPFGSLIRKLKIDELPQFWNIIVGDMSLVGPRAEDPLIVNCYYSDWMKETLCVCPGVTSPGAIYGYLMGDLLIDNEDPEGSYVTKMLVPKLALERAYLERADFFSDIYYVMLTAWAIFAYTIDRPLRLPAVDLTAARKWVDLSQNAEAK